MNLRAARPIVLIFLVVLVAVSSYEGNAANKYVLPDSDRTSRYVNNLIDSYNALVRLNDSYRPDFASIKVYFKLYHDVGYSFKVIVAQALPNDPVANAGIANATDFLDLAFIPIVSNLPDIDMEYNRSASEIPGFGGLTGAGTLREDLTINWTGGVRYQAIAYCILKSDISGNDTLNSINSKNAAVNIYSADKSRIPKTSQTQIQTIIIQTQASEEPFDFRNPVVIFVAIIGGLVFFFLAGIPAITSLIEFIHLIANREEQKKIVRDVKKLTGRKEQDKVKKPKTEDGQQS